MKYFSSHKLESCLLFLFLSQKVFNTAVRCYKKILRRSNGALTSMQHFLYARSIELLVNSPFSFLIQLLPHFICNCFTRLLSCEFVLVGVPVRSNSNNSFMHHKFCILDSPQRVTEIVKKRNKKLDKKLVSSILLTGSLNWTNQVTRKT